MTSLDGSAGNDLLFGQAGNDRLTGGTGADLYVFNQVASATTPLWTSQQHKETRSTCGPCNCRTTI